MGTTRTDVVVIGSGIGGMCAAALLAEAGYRTIVLEEMALIGGRYSCIDWKGYRIPTGGHMVNHGEDDPIYRTLQEVDAPEVEFKPFDVPVRYRIEGKEHQLEGRGGLRRVVEAASRDATEANRVMAALYDALRGTAEPPERISLQEWLNRYTGSSRIHNIFQCQATAFTGVNASQFPAREFVRFLRTYARLRRTLVPRGTGKAIIDALRSAIERRGGRVLTSARVIRILVQDGTVTGVEAEGRQGRERFEARAVVSNIGPRETIALAGQEHFDEAYLRLVSRDVRPSVAMDYILVSDEPLLDSLLFTTDARRTETWSPTSLFWPEEFPRGKHVIEGYAAPPSSTDYDPREEYDVFLQDLEQEFPKFQEKGGRILLARRFCGNWPINRCFQGYDPAQATPVRFLFNVGDGVKPSGWVGASGAALSARLVAEDLKHGLSPGSPMRS